jgi:L-iditol 2-dehydrogenase
MKALVYLGPRRMELREAPDPVPGPGEVVISTSASAVCGSDLHGFREASPRRIPPLVMGHETAGRIDLVGVGVPVDRVGERVVLRPILACGRCDACVDGRTNVCEDARLVGRDLPGGFAERLTVPAAAAVPISSAVPDDVATLTEPLANAVHVTSRSVREGDDVLVIGAGPIGALVVRMALARGARAVYATDLIGARLELARKQGASPLDGDDPEGALREATGERGVDVVIDTVGIEGTWALGLRAVRAGGRIEVVGLGSARATIDHFAVIGKEVTITGSFGWTESDFARALELVEGGAIETAGWFARMPLAEGQRAFEELVDGTDRFKVVLVP